ncbi:Uncharacterised protein [Providencia rustigianii]|nr:Uncharacterised protein [Providencia rustigianii]
MPIRLPDELPAVNFFARRECFCHDNDKGKPSGDPSLESTDIESDAKKNRN